MRGPVDHGPEMLDEDTIEAIVRGRPVDGPARPLAAFARAVRVVGDAPGAAPNAELARFLRGGGATVVGGATDLEAADRPVAGRVTVLAARVAALGAAKLVLGATLAAASVTGAGAAGVLPGPADDAVRSAIETVTPVRFDDEGDGGGEAGEGDGTGDDERPAGAGEHGDEVSDDATGESDGVPGVDGPSVAEGAPGAEHRPDDPGAAGDGTGPSDATGLDRADETPAEPRAPDAPPATVPTDDADQGDDQGGGRPEVVPSTVPTASGRSTEG